MDTKDIIARYKAWRDNGANEVSLSPEQVYTLLWNWPGFNPDDPENEYGYLGRRPMGEFFNALSKHGVLKNIEPEAPAKPAYLPIKCKVRVEDLEVGCVLRFCGNQTDAIDSGDCGGQLKLGDLHRVTHIEGRVFLDVPGWEYKDNLGWTETGMRAWEFVSNPNYVHGFRIGERVYTTVNRGREYTQNLTVSSGQPKGSRFVHCDGDLWPNYVGAFKPDELTRDPTKAYGYKAPVEYKVKDGVAKEGDTVYWLAKSGDPQKVTVGSGNNWRPHKDNIKGYPNAYQLREPQKVWDYKVK